MSHELRTPLNAIGGYAELIEMGVAGSITEQQREYLARVRGSQQHLLAIINDLLDLARIESGKIDLELQAVDCAALAAEVVSSLQPLATSKALELSVVVDSKRTIALADRRALSQILLNLTNNAVKFTEAGSVSLTVRRRSPETIEISVHDTGPGICVDDQLKLFTPFEQLASTQLRPRDGTGLGLYISKKLAAAVGGNIELVSELGEGSTFSLLLPAA